MKLEDFGITKSRVMSLWMLHSQISKKMLHYFIIIVFWQKNGPSFGFRTSIAQENLVIEK
jgi:hypothetical protein